MKKLLKITAAFAFIAAVLLVAGCDNAVKPQDEVPAASKDMAFVIQLPGAARVLYYTEEDATSYKVELKKSDTVVSTKTGNPGDKVRLEVTEEGSYTIAVSAYKDTVLIAEGQKDASVSFGDGDVNVTVTLTPKVKGAEVGVNIEWETPKEEFVTFGSFPQTIKASGVTITSETKTVGAFTYYKGSDGEWYAKLAENAYQDGYTYSDGTAVAQGGTSEKYFKVEPIKWRILTDNYNGKKLLLAENVLSNCAYYDYPNVYRTINGSSICPNNYKESRIRAYLNGLSYDVRESNSATQTTSNEFLNKGFLQSAFTEEELAKIAVTTVDNSVRSTNPDSNASQWNDGINDYTCENTMDKIFLLSEQEVTTEVYGFEDWIASSENRRLMTTDFAKANGAYHNNTEGQSDTWWLRSPSYSTYLAQQVIFKTANAGSSTNVVRGDYGVVPALCIE